MSGSSSTLLPRDVVHRGVVEVAGFAFAVANAPQEATARNRILELWEAGAVVWRTEDALVLQLATPRLMAAEGAPGLPLVRNDDFLLGAPLSCDQIDRLSHPGSLVYVRVVGGEVTCSELSERVDVGGWVDVDGLHMIPGTALFTPPNKVMWLAAPEPLDVRDALGDVIPARDAGAEALIARIREVSQPDELVGGGVGQDIGGRDSRPGLARRFLEAVATWLAGDRTSSANDEPRELDPGEEPVSRFRRWLNRGAWSFLRMSRLSALLGRQHARYLERMMRMFEEGNLSEALRHAIPLSNEVGTGEPAFPPLGGWGARDSLSIVPYRAATARSLLLQDELFAGLRQMYRRAFDELVKADRIDEASFVMLELLGNALEGVEFLEQHERFELAARVAEARRLAPGLVVRLWFLAGNTRRALLVARRHGAFADAVQRLEHSQQKHADLLRSHWAKHLADGGDFAGAVDVIWPLDDSRDRAVEWMDNVLESGGVASARMLARKLGLMPESFEQHREELLAVLDDADIGGLPGRRALLLTLIKQPDHPQTTSVARAGVRAMVRDNANLGLVWDKATIKAVASYSGDQALVTDLRRLVEHQVRERELFALRVGATDRGLTKITDAVRLPEGRLLVALGERGARLLTADGRTITHFDEPTADLVISDHGDRALGVIKRGESLRLTRFDLRNRTARRWTNAPTGSFCPTYDGQMWFFARGDELMGIDTLADGFGAIWHVPGMGAHAALLARNSHHVSALLADEDSECWTFELPELVLRRRRSAVIGLDRAATIVEAVAPDGTTLNSHYGADNILSITIGERVLRRRGELDQLRTVPMLTDEHAVYCMVEDDREVVYLEARNHAQAIARIELEGSSRPGHRLDDRALCVWDALGRLIVYDIEGARVIADLRL